MYNKEDTTQPRSSEHDTDDTSSEVEEERTSVWDVRRPHYSPYLLHRLQVRGETTVHREDLLIDDGSDRQAVEAVGERLPELDVVPPFACAWCVMSSRS